VGFGATPQSTKPPWHGIRIHKRWTTEEDPMKNKALMKKIAKLEFINDQLASEISYLERLTKSLGFAEGLKTLKEAAIELLEQDGKKGSKKEDEANPPRSN
jgi:hypothetical protein